ncbi:hypothetical protein OG948_60090 (plasmid) [Embleya sp. NBC_00888]|uniref:hypothetical protein n=1 Tax=Embleya sp. NBC_00888 TaxID=2975960 RepID=UPI002F908F1D|nr:hypothetical protein OG948_60090 [Embleya sp. NBC_00888]
MGLVVVHGIWNRQRGMSLQAAAEGLAERARSHVRKGLTAAGLVDVPVPNVVMAYYAHLLDDASEEQAGEPADPLEGLSEHVEERLREWLRAAGVPEPTGTQAMMWAPLRGALGWLARQRLHELGEDASPTRREEFVRRWSRAFVASIREVDAYTSIRSRRLAVRNLVANRIRETCPRVVVAHSLGSVVAYETLHAYPDLRVELLVTVGSPLAVSGIFPVLEPEPHHGLGKRPAGVDRWLNIADVGDFVATPAELGGLFSGVEHETVDAKIADPHTLGMYLGHRLTAAAIAPYLAL